MLTPEPLDPAVLTPEGATVSAAGSTDAEDLAWILADDADIEARRQAIAARHAMDGGGPMMLALSRVAGLAEQLAIEVRLIRNYLGGGS